jgi:hypothetical protein
VFFGTFVLILFLHLVFLYIIVSSYVSGNRKEVELVERLRDYLKIYMTRPLFWLQVGCWENQLIFKSQNISIQEKQFFFLKLFLFMMLGRLMTMVQCALMLKWGSKNDKVDSIFTM